VDAVVVFHTERCHELIGLVNPLWYVKGHDYSPENMDEGEKIALQSCDARVCIIPREDEFHAGDITPVLLDKDCSGAWVGVDPHT
jgi:bifunctional ADP-heptose synthase (sugar kinase/adenylyltransferase)